jgi:hypothetical protein
LHFYCRKFLESRCEYEEISPNSTALATAADQSLTTCHCNSESIR